MYKLVFFVPDSHVESVKTAIFNVGAGKIGDYSHCAWQTLGQGQFKPLEESDPYSGIINEIKYVEEWRVELIIDSRYLQATLETLKVAHPYETPAFDLIKLDPLSQQ